jgi:CRISPR/Cas system type I-B associated protein Csh2 (Cas7 group RAMP superfamily)
MRAGVGRMNITGASGAIPRNDFRRMDEHAQRYYKEIRKRSSDVKAIAENTGFSVEDVKKIKEHIFLNKYDLGDEFPTNFDPDYDMAVSWQRLVDGKSIQEMDIVMLKHELMEHELMLEKCMDYRDAHKIAEEKYNYSKYIKDLNFKEDLL